MSIRLHLRAVAESEIRDDHTWLAAFTSEAWDNHPDAYAAGSAASIDKIWNSVDRLYAAARVLEADAGKPWTLPIYGGRPVAHSADAALPDPPLMILEPQGVSRAADFLARVSFDELWNVTGAELVGPGQDEPQAEQEFLGLHGHLRAFCTRAAAAGHAVVKAVWA
ncbi:DUF1877 family protein [Streptomyces actuosus]|uniref:DUF1877 family protein n=1 Tax=Streptomyces actuosus TaxID=1885 RepID=A0ABS2VTX2_STRAS|nr:DUF1877 family protein [Streptomyces actuosus]MBN0046506.1 DUF1877 family protein [Streptomyces actuosus]